MGLSVESTISATFVCDVDQVTTVVQPSSNLPAGWKKIRVHQAPTLGGSAYITKYICPAVLASSDPEVLQQLRDLVAS